MELTIRISQEDYADINIGKCMNGEKTDIKNATLMSLHMKDGALEEILEKAEMFDNVPDEIRDEFPEYFKIEADDEK